MKIYSRKELNEYSYSLTYDDVSLIPTEISRIKSRKDADTGNEFLGMKLSLPVISSPMESVTGLEMAKELTSLGCIGILNRFDSSLKEVINRKENGKGITAVSIALNTTNEIIEKLASAGYLICIDTANANNLEVLNKVEDVKKKFNVKLIVGNIAHGATLKDLENAGADAVRVGIGSGSVCTTSIQTGIGIGQVSSLLNVCLTKEEQKLLLPHRPDF